MATLPDLESAEQAYERGWNEAVTCAMATLLKSHSNAPGWVRGSLWEAVLAQTAYQLASLTSNSALFQTRCDQGSLQRLDLIRSQHRFPSVE